MGVLGMGVAGVSVCLVYVVHTSTVVYDVDTSTDEDDIFPHQCSHVLSEWGEGVPC